MSWIAMDGKISIGRVSCIQGELDMFRMSKQGKEDTNEERSEMRRALAVSSNKKKFTNQVAKRKQRWGEDSAHPKPVNASQPGRHCREWNGKDD